MTRHFTVLGVAALASVAGAQEKEIRLRDAPIAVIQNVTARVPNAKVSGVSTETEGGKQTYEVSLKERGRNIDVTATPDGVVTLIEKEITARELPAAVTRLLREKYPKASYKIVESVTNVSGSQETLAFYEVLLVDARKQRLEVQVAADGSRILKVETKKPGEPDE